MLPNKDPTSDSRTFCSRDHILTQYGIWDWINILRPFKVANPLLNQDTIMIAYCAQENVPSYIVLNINHMFSLCTILLQNNSFIIYQITLIFAAW
jgi:hypothetical protein